MGIDRTDIKTAMYGHETISGVASSSGGLHITDIGLGGGRKCTPNNNTTISAIGLLFRCGDDIRLSVFHNCYAKIPIHPNWMRRSTIRHFAIDPGIRGQFPEWQEITPINT